MRTTDTPGPRPERVRASRAATAKIVLSGCSTGLALGLVGVMALAEASPVDPRPASPGEADAGVAAPPPALPPKRVITYAYRPVVVYDGEAAQVPRAAPPRAAGASPSPRAAVPAAAKPRASAATTTTTQAS